MSINLRYAIASFALFVMTALILMLSINVQANINKKDLVFSSGHPSLQKFSLPKVPYPKDNAPNAARIELGKMLFFDTRVSGDGNMSCATCHNPLYGWSDGLATAKGFRSKVLGRATPTIVNSAYNSLHMWDGRKKSLEDQATGPMEAKSEMHTDIPRLIKFLKHNKGYRAAFKKAYPGEPIDRDTISKALASFERTVVSNASPFDRWVKGDRKAMTKQQIQGFKLFVNRDKGNCVVCHDGPNFTNDSFHNIGLKSFAKKDPDLGRYKERPVKLMKGAFKTPTLRDITLTAPYFHDGSAKTLTEVVDHYVTGGETKTNLSPEMKKLDLSKKEKQAIVAFLEALTTQPKPFVMPVLPAGSN